LASSSSQNEEARKKIIDSKELNLLMSSLEDTSLKLVHSTANLILSLSRAKISIKKYLIEVDITGILFILSETTNIDLQITITNSLCNFLLDTQSVKLLKNYQ